MSGFKPLTTFRCRCQIVALPNAPKNCRHCNGTGVRVGIDFERVTGRSDLEHQNTNTKENGMALPTVKTSREARDPRDARILLVAPPKTGKTTLAAAWAPDTTLILDTHRGSALLDGEHYVQPVHQWTEFEQAVNDITAGDHQFRTIVVDLVEDIYKMADKHAANAYGKVAAGIVEYGKGTSHAEAIFRDAIDKLLGTPYGIWFLSHVETIQDGNQITHVPKIDKRVRTYVEGACDFCLLAEARGPVRELRTVPSARYQIGSRVPLPDPMPLDARALYAEIAKGLGSRRTPAAETTAQTTPQTTTPEEIAA